MAWNPYKTNRYRRGDRCRLVSTRAICPREVQQQGSGGYQCMHEENLELSFQNSSHPILAQRCQVSVYHLQDLAGHFLNTHEGRKSFKNLLKNLFSRKVQVLLIMVANYEFVQPAIELCRADQGIYCMQLHPLKERK